MRLIDADDFKKFIKEKYKDGESTDDIKDQFLFDLSYQPTAYDVDAVVEELEKEVEKSTISGMGGVSYNLDATKIIDIVRKGGVK